MSLKKTAAILAAAGALAAISVPAMAFENEFHGIYNINFTGSNIQAGTAGDATIGGTRSEKKMNNYFEQRARIFYTAKASDDLKLVSGFEFDNRWGAGRANAANTPTGAGDLDTDFTNFEMKWMYLDFNLGSNFNTKAGMLPYKDTIKGVFIDADLPAILTTTKLGAYTLGIGFSRFDDDGAVNLDGTSRLGDSNKDLFILDNTFAITKDTKVALSYYFLADYATGNTGGVASAQGPLNLASNNNDIMLHTFGLSGESKVGPATLSGFLAAQAGHGKNLAPNGTSIQYHGWAANVAAKMAIGPGTARTAFLFTSGDNTDTSRNDSHYKGWVTSSVNSYNEGDLQIMARATQNSPTSTDTYIRRNVTNLALLTLGYDANLTDKIFLNGNLGFGWTPASGKEAGVGTRNSSDFMGTEANLTGGYKVSPNLTLKATAAYMLLGGLYKDSSSNNPGSDNPENPYSMRLHAQFKF